MYLIKWLFIYFIIFTRHSEGVSSPFMNVGILEGISTGIRVPVCASYFIPVGDLPQSEKEAIPYRVIDLTHIDVCNDTLNWQHVVQNKSLVAFTWRNCSILDVTKTIQTTGGQGVIVVSPSIFTSLPSVEEMNAANISISAAVISTTSFETIIESLPDKFYVREYIPPDKFYTDLSLIIVWVIAVMCVGLGTIWESWIEKPLRKKWDHNYEITNNSHNNGQPENKSQLPTNGNKEQTPLSVDAKDGKIQPERKNKESGKSPPPSSPSEITNKQLGFTLLKIVIILVITTGIIILLFYFYDYVVYFLMGFFAVIATAGMFWCFDTFTFLIPCGSYRLKWRKFHPEIRQLFIFIVCCSITACWVIFRKEYFAWVLQDILVVFAAVRCIGKLHMFNFKLCLIFMIIFFLYTTLLIFATPPLTPDNRSVMVALASGGFKEDGSFKEHVPMSIRVPSMSSDPLSSCVQKDNSVGLLDVVVPGAVVSYCFNFGKLHGLKACLIYFLTSLGAQGLGLIFTFITMNATDHAQPALLYITPCVLVAAVIVSAARKELLQFWNGKVKETSLNTSYSPVSQYETRC